MLSGLYENNLKQRQQPGQPGGRGRKVITEDGNVIWAYDETRPGLVANANNSAAVTVAERAATQNRGSIWSAMVDSSTPMVRQAPAPAGPLASSRVMVQEVARPPSYDAAAERARLEQRAAAENRWSSSGGSSSSALVPSARSGGGDVPRVGKRGQGGGQAATSLFGDSAAPSSDSPRGKKYVSRGGANTTAANLLSGTPFAAASNETARSSVLRRAPNGSTACGSTFQIGHANAADAADAAAHEPLGVAKQAHWDAFAIGNARSDKFVLRSRSTKKVSAPPGGGTTINFDGAGEDPRLAHGSRRVLREPGGGSSIGIDRDGAVSAALEPARATRKQNAFMAEVVGGGGNWMAEGAEESLADRLAAEQRRPEGRAHLIAPHQRSEMNDAINGNGWASETSARGPGGGARGGGEHKENAHPGAELPEPPSVSTRPEGEPAASAEEAAVRFILWYREKYGGDDPPEYLVKRAAGLDIEA